MAQQLEAHTAVAEDRSLIPRNHKKQHTTTYNSSLAELDTLLWLLVEKNQEVKVSFRYKVSWRPA